MATELDKNIIAWFVATAALGVLVAWLAQPLVADNKDAVNIIVTTFSILAGFLVTIMTVVATPSNFSDRSWRYYSGRRDVIKTKLIRHKFLFMAYLVTLALIFAASLVPESWPKIIEWIQRIYLFLGTVAFANSLRLPGALMGIQLEHHDDLIKHHRKKAGIKED